MFCQSCGMEVASNYKICPKCGGKQFGVNMMGHAQRTAPTVESLVAAESHTEPTYFAVSVSKLLIMSIFTLSLYELYWFYRNWKLIKERESLNIMPVARAIFAVFFCYDLFKRIRTSATSLGLGGASLQSGLLATGWIVLILLQRLPGPFGLVTFFGVLFLLPVQKAVNQINDRELPSLDPNDRFTTGNVVAIVIGCMLWVLVIIGAFMG